MELLFEITVIFAIAAVVLYISSKLKVPTIVGLLLSGLIAGPYGLGLVTATEEVETMAEIGVLLLLFTIGMEFSLEKLLRTKRLILVGGGLQVLLTIVLVCLIGMAIGLAWQQALFVGFLFSLSSTAIVLHMLQEHGLMDTRHGQAALSILIFQDIIIIPMMLVVPYLAGTQGGGLAALGNLAIGVALVAVIIYLARTLVPRILRSIVHTRNQELFLVSILVICFATAFVTYELGLKLALGAFLAGLIISESEFSYDALSNILPLKKIFTSIFFVSIGMLLNLSFFASNLLIILAVVLAVLVTKTVIVTGLALWLKLSLRNALIAGLSLCQVGEFAFILSETGNDNALLTFEQYQVFLAVSIFSMAVSPFIINSAPKLALRIIGIPGVLRMLHRINVLPKGQESKVSHKAQHLVIIGYGVNGQMLSKQLAQQHVPYAIIEKDEKRVEHAREDGEPIYGGDARVQDVLLRAAVDKAKTVVIAVHDACTAEEITAQVRKTNHHAHIIVRSRFPAETEALTRLGANEVITEQMEAAGKISERAILQFQN
ncbi:MAG: cation:proton antiporter [Saprospiraceae bacterium]|nr:cation:proton antiporter [Saprospiraceae bacterium]